MNNILKHIDSDIKKLIDLSHKLGQLNERLLWYSDMESEFYDEKKCKLLRQAIDKSNKEYFYLREKWLDVR